MTIRWRDMDARCAPGPWHALELTVTGASGPSLDVPACHPRCVRLSIDGTPHLWARIEDGYWGYHLLRTRDRSVSLLLHDGRWTLGASNENANALALSVFVPRLEAALSRSRALPGGSARWEEEVKCELARQGIDDAERFEGLGVAP